MVKREYTGKPIDQTGLRGETHLSEVNGETVAGSTEDDWNEEYVNQKREEWNLE